MLRGGAVTFAVASLQYALGFALVALGAVMFVAWLWGC